MSMLTYTRREQRAVTSVLVASGAVEIPRGNPLVRSDVGGGRRLSLELEIFGHRLEHGILENILRHMSISEPPPRQPQRSAHAIA